MEWYCYKIVVKVTWYVWRKTVESYTMYVENILLIYKHIKKLSRKLYIDIFSYTLFSSRNLQNAANVLDLIDFTLDSYASKGKQFLLSCW